MSGVNKVIIVGRLGADPEHKTLPSGSNVCNMSVATSEKFKNKEGELKETTEWHRVVAFNKIADLCNEYLSKGKQVYLEGKLQTRSWEDKDGNKKYTTEILALQVQFLSPKDEGGAQRREV